MFFWLVNLFCKLRVATAWAENRFVFLFYFWQRAYSSVIQALHSAASGAVFFYDLTCQNDQMPMSWQL